MLQGLVLNNRQLTINKASTINAYHKLEQGSSDYCGCHFCQVFKKHKHHLYPPEFLKILNQLGIDYLKEAEAYHILEIYQGAHLYGGWFHFVGRMESVSANECNTNNWIRLTKEFEYTLVNFPEVVSLVFRGKDVLQLEFKVIINWAINGKIT